MLLKADLHIHTLLSPCGDIWMSPRQIISNALDKNLQIIGISDHNTTLNAEATARLGSKHGISVLMGAEVCTSEEVHCLCFMRDSLILNTFQQILADSIIKIAHDEQRFGEQLIVDEDENITGEIDYLLLASTRMGIDALRRLVHELDGIFIPAHINRAAHSIFSQLGFVPDGLNPDALEISRAVNATDFKNAHPELNKHPMITSSDAHYTDDIGRCGIVLQTNDISFDSIKTAIAKKKYSIFQ